MSYAAINSRRMPYDIDGTEIGCRYHTDTPPSLSVLAGYGIQNWLDSTAKGNLNKEDRSQTFGGGSMNGSAYLFWFFFPEQREVNFIGLEYATGNISAAAENLIQGSNDTTNGIDGSWETATFTKPAPSLDTDAWRKDIFAVSFSSPVKAIRVGSRFGAQGQVTGVHIYGDKAAGQTPDDVVFCNASGTEYTVLKDFGDTPEGSTYNDTFYLKNVSSKQANALNIQLNNSDYAISLDQANWGAVVNFASLGAGQVSPPIHIRKTLGPPLLALGPRSARAILTIGSFT